MHKIIFSMLLVTAIACNSKSPKTATESTSENAAKQPVTWTREAEMNWLNGCVEESKEKLGEEKAFNQCKCILKQFEERNPTNDSLQNEKISNDKDLLAEMAKKCEDAK